MSLFSKATQVLSTITSRKIFTRRSILLSVCSLFLVTLVATPKEAGAQNVLYTALGDSIGFGLFAPIGDGYVPTYARRVAADTGANVTYVNTCIPGWTSSDLLSAIRGNFLLRVSIATSSVVTVNIGGNDLLGARGSYGDRTCGGADNQDCLRATVATFRANWNAILNEVLSLRSTRNTIIRTQDIYNPYVNEDRARDTWPNDQGNDFQVSKVYLDQINNHIAMTSTGRNIPYARVYQAFNGPGGNLDAGDRGFIAFDGLHPNGRGHQLIADLLGNLGYSPFRIAGFGE
jgi:lysophospholipase L1-like esterase